MRDLESALASWVLAYLLNSLWQVPLVFCAALAAARLARRAGPQMEHRVWVSALMLQAVLPLCHLHLNELWGQAWGLLVWFRNPGIADGHTRIILGAGTASRLAVPWLSAQVLASAAAAYECALLYFAGRLGWGLWKTEGLRRRAVRLELTSETARKTDRFRRLLGIGRGAVQIASSPATPGISRQAERRRTGCAARA
jgi:hypothetical protein